MRRRHVVVGWFLPLFLLSLAATAHAQCLDGQESDDTLWERIDQPPTSVCDDQIAWMYRDRITTCDGSVHSTDEFQFCSKQNGAGWINSANGDGIPKPAPGHKSCIATCPKPEPCGGGPGCAVGAPVSVVGDPNALGEGDNFFPLDIVALPAAGFPPEFTIVLRTGSGFQSNVPGGSLSVRATHSLGPAMVFIPGTPNEIEVLTENGAVLSYHDTSADVWSGDDGTPGYLAASSTPSCSGGTVTAYLADGTKLTFSEFCTGLDSTEGRVERVDRPNGDYETFSYSAGNTSDTTTVTNRLGAQITLTNEVGGRLRSVLLPNGDDLSFDFASLGDSGKQTAYLSGVDYQPAGGTSSPLYAINWATSGTGGYYAVTDVDDGAGRSIGSWSLTDSSMDRIATEQAEGSSSMMTFGWSPATGHTTVSFTAADGLSATNDYYYSSQFSDNERARVTSRVIRGACPNCGSFSSDFQYWTGSTFLKAQSDGNGFWTDYEDDPSGPTESLSYTSNGEPLVLYTGCNSSTDCPAGGALPSKRTAFSYVEDASFPAGTGLPKTIVQPSVVSGQTITETKTYVAGTTRLQADIRQGYTTSDLGGSLNVLRCRVTTYSYGGGAGGVELSEVDGPFWDDDCPDTRSLPPAPSDAPKTTYAYYSATDTDPLTSAVVGGGPDLNRLASSTRYVDSGSRKLVTTYGAYDGAGRALKVGNPDGTVLALAYDLHGNITTSTVDSTSTSAIETDYCYDGAGKLTGVALPLVNGSSTRAGYRLIYDAASRVTDVEHGSYAASCASSFTPIESAHFFLDDWGNRTRTEIGNGAYPFSSATFDLGATYDAFNRVKEIDRPYGTSTGKRTFAYDANGNLTSAADNQQDTASYGSTADMTKYDRFNLITRLQQGICDHPTSDVNGTCSSPRTSTIDFVYDLAQQLSQVTIHDGVRGGDIQTGYVRDDFGELVKVTSPDSGVTTFEYDGAGRLIATKDARGKIFNYQYDRTGRLTAKLNASPLSITATSGANGTTQVNPDGTITYTPNSGFSGTDSYSYTVHGRNGDTSTSTVNVTVGN